jgi:hypothetical protein
LIVDPFATHAALVVLAIGRHARRGAVLAGRIVIGGRRRCALGAGCLGGFGARFALGRMTRGASECGMPHDASREEGRRDSDVGGVGPLRLGKRGFRKSDRRQDVSPVIVAPSVVISTLGMETYSNLARILGIVQRLQSCVLLRC